MSFINRDGLAIAIGIHRKIGVAELVNCMHENKKLFQHGRCEEELPRELSANYQVTVIHVQMSKKAKARLRELAPAA